MEMRKPLYKDKTVFIDHELDKHKDVFVVNWNLGNRCNYRCSYCNETLNSGSVPWLDAEAVLCFADKVIAHYSGKLHKKILFEFTGGEVTLYKDLYKVLKYLKENGCKTEILSNASPRLAFWEKIKDVLDYAILSYHAEHCAPEHFYEVVKSVNRNINVHVNIMMNRNRFNLCRDLGVSIMDLGSGISLRFQPLLEKLAVNAKLIGYTEEQLASIGILNDRCSTDFTGQNRYRGRMIHYTSGGGEFIMDPLQYVTEKKNHWRGWLCWTGLEQIVVSQWGEVFRAWCMQEQLGNISGHIEFPTKPVVCTKKTCHCNIDMLCKKQLPVYLDPANLNRLKKIGLV